MSWLDGMRERARALLRREEVERELEDELAFHIEQETIRVAGYGMTNTGAQRQARVAFGSAERFREEVRDTWTGTVVRGVMQDVRHGMRRLSKQPGFTAVVLLTLALGIGANAAMFSLVRGVLLEPLPYAHPDELVLIWHESRSQADETWTSDRELLEYRKATQSFAALSAYTDTYINLADAGEPERVRAGVVSTDMMATLGVAPARGRDFTTDDGVPGGAPVVMLGHELWQRRYGGALDIVGSNIDMNGSATEVIGIMPPGFQLPLDYRDERATELWLPLRIDATQELPFGSRANYIVGRLKPGVTATSATVDVKRAADGWLAAGLINPSNITDTRAAVPIADLLLNRVRPALLLLFGAVAVILLIACANVTHLLLARADSRRNEVATQAALGASRWRIARQLVVETLLLAVGGALLGLGVAYMALRAALALMPANVIRTRDVSLDLAVLGFVALLALLAAVLAGLAPALELARADVARSMSSARGNISGMRRGVRRGLVIVETALAVVLAVGGALLARSFAQQRAIDLGFETADMLTFRIALPRTQYAGDAAPRFFRDLLARIEDMPGVKSAAAVRVLPLTQTIGDWSITVEHREQKPDENPNGDWQIVTPGYFETMGITLAAGRFLTDADNAAAPLVAVINESMAARYWPDESAVGKRFHLGNGDQPWVEIVGVARPVRHNAVVEDPREEMYLVHEQWSRARNDGFQQFAMSVVVASTGDPTALMAPIRAAVRALDPKLPIADVRTMDDVAGAALAQPRFTTTLMLLFAALALLLAVIGLYGVISYVAARRTHEMGLRSALGARPRQLTDLVMREGVIVAGTGILIGILASVWATRLIATQLYGVTALDPVTFFTVPTVLVGVAAVASYLPARRAARVSPLTALRAE